MKKAIYIFLFICLGHTVPAREKNDTLKKVISKKAVPARKKQCSGKNCTKADRRPVPKISVSNPHAMKEV